MANPRTPHSPQKHQFWGSTKLEQQTQRTASADCRSLSITTWPFPGFQGFSFEFWVSLYFCCFLLLIAWPSFYQCGYTHAITHLGRLRNVSWILDFYLARLYQGIQMLVSISWHACWDTLLLDPCYFTLHQNSIEARSASKVPHNVQAEGHWHGNSIL